MKIDRRSVLGWGTSALGAATLASLDAKGALAAEPAASEAAKDGAVHLSARSIEPPRSISPQARAYLASRADRPYEKLPAASDKDGWRRYVSTHDAAFVPASAPPPRLPGVDVDTRTIAGVTVHVAVKTGAPSNARKPFLYLHGGGWTNGGGALAKIFAQLTALQYGGTVYAVDYRTPPDHPFPVPLDDCLAVYRALLADHPARDILVGGGSAGGNLSAAMLHKAHDQQLPMPAALFLDTPVTDLTGISDTLQTNRYIDVLLKHWDGENVRVYAGDADLAHPYLSPLNGDVGYFPPTYLRSGTRDLMLSDTVRMHAALRKAGVEATLYVREAMPHGGFGMMTPEDAECREDTIKWLARYWMKA